MRPNRIARIIPVLLLSILSCGLPATGAPPAGPEQLATFIAGTAMSAASQTAAAGPIQAAAATETPTSIPAATITPRISGAGTSLEIMADGSTKLTDHRYRMEVLVPPGWLAVRVNEPEYYEAWESEWASNPTFTNDLQTIQTMDPERLRVYAMDVRPDHMVNEELTRLTILHQLSNAESLEAFIEEAQGPRPFEDYELISDGYQDWPDGRRAFVIEEKWSAAMFNGEIYTIYYKAKIFKTSDGALIFDILTPLSFKDVVLPDFEQFVDGVVQLP